MHGDKLLPETNCRRSDKLSLNRLPAPAGDKKSTATIYRRRKFVAFDFDARRAISELVYLLQVLLKMCAFYTDTGRKTTSPLINSSECQ